MPKENRNRSQVARGAQTTAIAVASLFIGILTWLAMERTDAPSLKIFLTATASLLYGTTLGACVSGSILGFVDESFRARRQSLLCFARLLGLGLYLSWCFVSGKPGMGLFNELVVIPAYLEVFVSMLFSDAFGSRTSNFLIKKPFPVSRRVLGILTAAVFQTKIALSASPETAFAVFLSMAAISFVFVRIPDPQDCECRRAGDFHSIGMIVSIDMLFVAGALLRIALTIPVEGGEPLTAARLLLPYVPAFGGGMAYLGLVKEQIGRWRTFLRQTCDERELFRHRSETDGMTELLNKNSLNAVLESRCCEAEAGGHGFGFMMLDIDRFKSFNDRYGHFEGDRALVFIARILRTTVRASDLCARYGGEEFSVLVASSDTTASVLLSERIRNRIERESAAFLATIDSNAGASDHPNFERITVSIGFTMWKSNDTPEQIIRRADGALYRAKDTGRNRVWMCIGSEDEFYPAGSGTPFVSKEPSAPRPDRQENDVPENGGANTEGGAFHGFGS